MNGYALEDSKGHPQLPTNAGGVFCQVLLGCYFYRQSWDESNKDRQRETNEPSRC